MTRLRLAAFDVDGTLVDSAGSIVAGVLACWDGCGFPAPDPVLVRRIIGLPWEESVEALLPGAGEAEFARIRAYHDEVARGLRTRPARHECLFSGVHETLDALEDEGFLLSIITSRPLKRLQELLDNHGLAGRFMVLKTTDHGPGKPAPDLMLQTLAEIGVDRDATVMVGDTIFDMAMARSAGTAAIGVSWGVHEAHELHDAGADQVVDEFHELPAVILRLTGG
jgi:phosphoglycolate phosphatase